jgi:hypothetical protein
MTAASPALAALLQSDRQTQRPGAGSSWACLLTQCLLNIWLALSSKFPGPVKDPAMQQPATLLAMASLAEAALPNTTLTCPADSSSSSSSGDTGNDRDSSTKRGTTAPAAPAPAPAPAPTASAPAGQALQTQQTPPSSHTVGLKAISMNFKLPGQLGAGGSPYSNVAPAVMRSVAEAVLDSMGAGPHNRPRLAGAALWESYARDHHPAMKDWSLVLHVHLAWLAQQHHKQQPRTKAPGSSGSSNSQEGQHQKSHEWSRSRIPAWHKNFVAAAEVAPWDASWIVWRNHNNPARPEDMLESVVLALNIVLNMDAAAPCDVPVSGTAAAASSGSEASQTQQSGCGHHSGSWLASLPVGETQLLLLQAVLLEGDFNTLRIACRPMHILQQHLLRDSRDATAYTAAAAALVHPVLHGLGALLLPLAAASSNQHGSSSSSRVATATGADSPPSLVDSADLAAVAALEDEASAVPSVDINLLCFAELVGDLLATGESSNTGQPMRCCQPATSMLSVCLYVTYLCCSSKCVYDVANMLNIRSHDGHASATCHMPAGGWHGPCHSVADIIRCHAGTRCLL